MIIRKLAEHLGLKASAGENGLDRQITGGYCGDLLSDVMSKAPEGCIWLTVQTHQNIVAVAVLRKIAAIVITGGNLPDKQTREKADQERIPILLCSDSGFDLAAKISELKMR